ncbi:M949_RS01915 family surface polysaccharide biosynthesis protein [Rahnella aceris]|uniref:M949_RS01915 family surface polysaccharide biosynthesis protein n=1 Tax=Rahnella sp. (strain Y9602) TaxID=2703885 RepID=UPI00345F4F1A
MNYYSALLLLFRLSCILFLYPMNSTFAKDLTSKVRWKDNSGEHLLVIKKEINQNNTGEHLSVKQVTKGKVDWVLNDYVNDCEVDINLNVIKESIEVNRSFSNGEGAVLFAYKIGCIGGLDPVTVKYFAFKNGVKHALRGEEHIIVGGESYGGETPPIPDHNLKSDKALLNYMLKKWMVISTTKIN